MTALMNIRGNFALPVRLSRSARREAFIETGKEPAWTQVMRFDPETDPTDEAFGWSVNFTQLERPLRERFVDVLDHVRIQDAEDAELFGGTPSPDGLCVTTYETLSWGQRGWSIRTGQDEWTTIQSVFSPGDGRTRRLLDVVAESRGAEAVDALLAGLPLVEELEGGDLTVEAVLDAYERAVELASVMGETMVSCRIGRPEFFKSMSISPDFIYIETTEAVDPIGLLRESAPESFDRAYKVCTEILELPDQAQQEFAKQACASADSLERSGLGPAAEDDVIARTVLGFAARDITNAENRRVADEQSRGEYLQERDRWVAEHGSERLRLAAERGYKIEGLYRRERLAIDLPAFVSALPRGSKVDEILNPSAHALQRETDALEKVAQLKLEGATVKLVHVKIAPDDLSSLDDGEYVQVTGYLGRHTVWEEVNGDIPF